MFLLMEVYEKVINEVILYVFNLSKVINILIDNDSRNKYQR